MRLASLASKTLLSVTEEGVEFAYPHDQTRKLNMTPEESMRIQKSIDSDIVMQLGPILYFQLFTTIPTDCFKIMK